MAHPADFLPALSRYSRKKAGEVFSFSCFGAWAMSSIFNFLGAW